MTQPIAYEVPLHERLETVPHDARLIIEDEIGFGTRYIPIGREAKLAAAELRRLHEVNRDLEYSLKLALEYWAHRQQRYKNRHPVWVQEANKALAKARGTE